VSAVPANRDAASVLRFGRFRHRYGEDTVFERGRNLILIDVIQRYSPFEAAVVPLAEATVFVFRF
jgi:hypothetical protein